MNLTELTRPAPAASASAGARLGRQADPNCRELPSAVIATDAGAPSEVLDGGAAGTLVPPGNVPALAAAVQAVPSNRVGLEAQVDRAEARAWSQYGVVATRARTVDLTGRVVLDAQTGRVAGRRVEV